MPTQPPDSHSHSAGQFAENSSGNIVHATLAKKRDKYSCQKCKQRVFLKQGNVKLHHFAHAAHNVVKCSGYKGGETVEHLEAKWLLAKHIGDFRFVMQTCATCEAPNTANCVRFTTPQWRVTVEGKVPGTGRRADVLLRLDTTTNVTILKAMYSLEVHHSHPVTAAKTSELCSVGCGVVEVSATAALACKRTEAPFYLVNEHTNGCIPWTCSQCMRALSAAHTARWIAYEAWYLDTWTNADAIIVAECELALQLCDDDDGASPHTLKRKAFECEASSRVSRRKLLQREAFSYLQLFVPERFKKTRSKCKGKCPACHVWIYHSHFHEFHRDDVMTTEERWWDDIIANDAFLLRMWGGVKRLVFCDNCVAQCRSCKEIQPRAILQRYGLCRLCNTDDDHFDLKCFIFGSRQTPKNV
jgi:hypothetical protein